VKFNLIHNNKKKCWVNSLIFSPCKRGEKNPFTLIKRERGRSQQARPFSHYGISTYSYFIFFYLTTRDIINSSMYVCGGWSVQYLRIDIEKYKSSLDTYFHEIAIHFPFIIGNGSNEALKTLQKGQFRTSLF